jgi:hypothetical protein
MNTTSRRQPLSVWRDALALTGFCICAIAPTIAAARPNVAAMTCAQAGAFVEKHGAVVANTSATTFDRFVRDQSLCMLGETTQPAFVTTKDNASCVIGYTCGGAISGIP